MRHKAGETEKLPLRQKIKAITILPFLYVNGVYWQHTYRRIGVSSSNLVVGTNHEP